MIKGMQNFWKVPYFTSLGMPPLESPYLGISDKIARLQIAALLVRISKISAKYVQI